MKSLLHLGSILLLLLTWIIGSHVIGARLLPEPSAVALALVDEARSGALTFNLSATLLRVFAAFAIAMVLQRSSKSANLRANFARQISLAFYSAHTKITLVQKLMKAQTPIVT